LVTGRRAQAQLRQLQHRGPLVNAQLLPAIPIGNSDQLEVGDFVLAIGNPFQIPDGCSIGWPTKKSAHRIDQCRACAGALPPAGGDRAVHAVVSG
jgi:hypothetical protein